MLLGVLVYQVLVNELGSLEQLRKQQRQTMQISTSYNRQTTQGLLWTNKVYSSGPMHLAGLVELLYNYTNTLPSKHILIYSRHVAIFLHKHVTYFPR